MALKVPFHVHSVSMTSAPVRVEFEGKPINAMVDCMEIELVSANPRHGTPTFRFVGEEVAVAEQLFKQGAKILVTVELEETANTETPKAA